MSFSRTRFSPMKFSYQHFPNFMIFPQNWGRVRINPIRLGKLSWYFLWNYLLTLTHPAVMTMALTPTVFLIFPTLHWVYTIILRWFPVIMLTLLYNILTLPCTLKSFQIRLPLLFYISFKSSSFHMGCHYGFIPTYCWSWRQHFTPFN